MRKRIGFWRPALFVIAGILWFGRPALQGAPAQTTTEKPSPLKQLLLQEQAGLEKDLANRMMLRTQEMSADRRSRLELAIDLRIIQRVFMARTTAASIDTDAHAAAWLRSRQIFGTIRAVEESLNQEAGALSLTQVQAMQYVHKLSFGIAELKNAKDIDSFCNTLAQALANTVSKNPVDAAVIFNMRPKRLLKTYVESTTADDGAPTLAKMGQDVQSLAAISPQLRSQLQALVALAAEEKDKTVFLPLLIQSVDLAKGLQSNTAVNPQSRLAIESQLAEGIALYSDPRMREAGKARLESLAQYRDMLTRIGKMNLPREQLEPLAPALAWAQQHPQAGNRLLMIIEQFAEACAAYNQLPHPENLSLTIRQPHDDLQVIYNRARQQFLEETARINGNNPAQAFADLESRVADLHRMTDLMDDILAAPASLDTLANLKFRPPAALEKKAQLNSQSAVLLMGKNVARNDGEKFLNALHTLANLSQSLNSKPLNTIPVPVLKKYVGNAFEQFEPRWRALILEQANFLIVPTTVELDAGKLARLQAANDLQEAMHQCIALENAMEKMAVLSRWVDWAIDPATVSSVVLPYRDAISAAFTGLANDNLAAVDYWHKLHVLQTPLMTMLIRVSDYADQCQPLPTGLPAELGRLASRIEGEPFAIERYTAYSLNLWSIFQRMQLPDEANRIALTLARRLNIDLKLGLELSDDVPKARRRRPRPQ